MENAAANHRAALASAHQLLLVTGSDLVSLWHTRTALDQVERHLGVDRQTLNLVLNRHDARYHHPRAEVEWHLGTRVAAVIPFDHASAQRAIGEQRPLIADPASRAARSLLKLAEQVNAAQLSLPVTAKRETGASWWRRVLRRQQHGSVARTALEPERLRLRRRPNDGAARGDPDYRRRLGISPPVPLHPSDRAAERVIRERVAEAVSRSLGDGRLLAPSGQDEARGARASSTTKSPLTNAARSTTNRPCCVDPDGVKRRLFDGLFGLGILQPLMDDPRVEEIIVNGPQRIFAIRDGRKEPVVGRVLRRRRRAAPAGQTRRRRRSAGGSTKPRRWSTCGCPMARA